jgi:hypothetical protein
LLHIASIDLRELRIFHPACVAAVIVPFLRNSDFSKQEASENNDQASIHDSDWPTFITKIPACKHPAIAQPSSR